MHQPTTSVPPISDSLCEQQPLSINLLECNQSQESNGTRWLQHIRGTASPEHSAQNCIIEAGQGGLKESYNDLWFRRNMGMIGRIDCSIIICGAVAVVLVITIVIILRCGVE